MHVLLWFALVISMTVYIAHLLRIAPIKDRKRGKNVRRQSILLFVVGVVGSLLFGLITTYIVLLSGFQFSVGTAISLFVFGGLFLLCYSMLLAYANWRIEFSAGFFSYHTMLGNKYEYKFNDILEYKQSLETFVVYMRDGRKLYIEPFDEDILDELLLAAKIERPKRPKIYRGRQISVKKLFGIELQVERRFRAIILLILLACVSCAGGALFVFTSLDAPFTTSNCQQVNICFQSLERQIKYSYRSKHISNILKDSEGISNNLGSINYAHFPIKDFTRDIQAGDLLTLTVSKDWTDRFDGLYIVGIKSTKKEYLSMEDSNRNHIDNALSFKWFGFGFLVLGVLCCYLVYYLLKNPTRRPNLQRLFFGKNYEQHLRKSMSIKLKAKALIGKQ